MNKKTVLLIAALLVIVATTWGIARRNGSPDAASSTDPGVTTTVPVPDGSQPTEGWQSFDGGTFSVRYPAGWSADGAYAYDALGPGKAIPGYRFTIPATLAAGTNLSRDSYFAVEKLGAGTCSASSFVDGVQQQAMVTENGRDWSMAKAGGAGAGNLYDETVYAASISGTCYGLRQFVHSTNIGNYDPGTVQEFDRLALDGTFAQFRATFVAK